MRRVGGKPQGRGMRDTPVDSRGIVRNFPHQYALVGIRSFSMLSPAARRFIVGLSTHADLQSSSVQVIGHPGHDVKCTREVKSNTYKNYSYLILLMTTQQYYWSHSSLFYMHRPVQRSINKNAILELEMQTIKKVPNSFLLHCVFVLFSL